MEAVNDVATKKRLNSCTEFQTVIERSFDKSPKNLLDFKNMKSLQFLTISFIHFRSSGGLSWRGVARGTGAWEVGACTFVASVAAC